MAAEKLHRLSLDEENALVVIDDAFSQEAVATYEDLFANSSRYSKTESDTPEHSKLGYSQFVVNFPLALLDKILVFQRIGELVERLFPDEWHQPYRMYCNALRFGDCTFPHRDCPRESTDLSALYYANATWESSWQGLTLFYDDNEREVLQAVLPRPGRVVLFRGRVPHCAQPPARTCYATRLSVVVKFYSGPAQEGKKGVLPPRLVG